MGAVYKAYDEVLDRYVAIKTMAEDIKWDPELKLRFYREARSAAGLQHPNIVTIHDLGEEGKITYIVMELLEGRELKSIIQEKDPLTLEAKLSIISQAADALHAAHLRGIIHRDVKPGNIYITPSGEVKILDFGIARIPTSDLTRSGIRLGTPIYMSPEQIRGEAPDAHSDLFSMGIVFYELLTHIHPFRGKNIIQTMDNILLRAHPPLTDYLPDAHPSLLPVLDSCLAKDPSKRYGSMADLARACRRLMDDLKAASQKMIRELQSVLPRLRQTAEMAQASPQFHQLLQEAQALLQQDPKPDYLALQRLVSALSKEFAQVKRSPADVASPVRSEAQPQAVESNVRQPMAAQEPAQASAPPPTPGREMPVEPPATAARATIPSPELGTPAEPPALVVQGTVPPQVSEAPPPIVTATPAAASPSPVEKELRGYELLNEGEVLLTEGRSDEALDLLLQAMDLLGPRDDINHLLEQARRNVDERKQSIIAQGLDAGRKAVAAGQFAQAIEALQTVLELEPERQDAIEMRRQAIASLEADRGEQVRREQGEREKQLGFTCLAEKRYREGLGSLRCAAELLGEDAAIRAGIEEAEEGLRAEDLRLRMQSELAEAATLMRSEAFEQARQRVQEVLQLSPGNTEASDLLAQIEQAQERKRRADQIANLLAQSRRALDQGNLDGAGRHAREALQLESRSQEASQLLKEIEQRQEKQRQDKIEDNLKLSREALARDNFQEAYRRANAVMQLDPKNRLARALLEDIEMAFRARERKLEQERAQQKGEAKAIPPTPRPEEAAALDQTVILKAPSRTGRPRIVLWVVAAVAFVSILAAGMLYLRHRRVPELDASAQLTAAKADLDQNRVDSAIDKLQRILSRTPDNKQAQALLADAQRQRKQKTIDSLLLEAQTLRTQNQFEESNKLLQRILDIDPAYEPALAVRTQIEAQLAATKSQEEQAATVKAWLAKAASLIAAGRLPEAGAELDKVVRIRPNDPELPRLRKKLAVKSAEAAQQQKEQLAAAEKQTRITELERKAEDLFKQGKYDEARETIERWLAEAPSSGNVQTLRTQVGEALSSLKAYQTAISGKAYEDALNAVTRLEKVNPTDPSLSELRRRVESSKAAAMATLSVYRLGEAGSLSLDDKPIGDEGEIENKKFPIGRHRLAVKNKQGKQSSANLDFVEGQDLVFVYDSATPTLRPMTPADRELLKTRRMREATHPFAVEHTHGFLKGNCTGSLIISGIQVAYNTEVQGHSFTEPFHNLKLTVKEEKIEISDARGVKRSFKAADAKQAAAIKQLWDQLEKLGK